MANDVVDGGDVFVFMSSASGATTWKAVAHATSHTLSKKMATRETSNKGSGVYVTRKGGRLDISVSVDSMYIDSDTGHTNLAEIMAAMELRTPVLLICGKQTSAGTFVPDTTTSGGTHWYGSGKFLITSCDANFPDQGTNSTFSASFEHASDWKENHLVTS